MNLSDNARMGLALLALCGVVAVGAWFLWGRAELSGVSGGENAPDKTAGTSPVNPGIPSPIVTVPLSRSPADPAPGLTACTLTVSDRARAPLAEADVTIELQGGARHQFATDRGGAVSFSASGGTMRVTVMASGYAPQGFRDLAVAPRVEVILEDRPALEGTLVVDGERPRERVPLEVLPDFWPAQLPGRQPEVSQLGGGAPGLPLAIDEEGRFSLRGVPKDLSGFVVLPETLRLATDREGRRLRFDHPGWLRIEAVRIPALVGRILASDLSPASDAEIACELRGARLTTRADRDGRFRIDWDWLGTRGSARIVIVSASEAGFCSLEVECPVRGVHDVGDVVIPLGRSVSIAVRDAEGAPIEGAVAEIRLGATPRWSSPTGARGESVLRGVPESAIEMKVAAAGFATATAAIPSSAAPRVAVVLHRAAAIEVVVEDEHGEPVGHVPVVVHVGEGPLFDGDRWNQESAEVRAGCTAIETGQWPKGRGIFVFRADEEGRAVISPLRRGALLRVSVCDTLGTVIFESQPLRMLGDAGGRLVARLQEPLYTLRGIVVEDRGRPLNGAAVSVRSAEALERQNRRDITRRGVRLRTPRCGAFEVGSVAARPVIIKVETEGHGSRSVALTAEQCRAPIEPIVLTRGYSAWIEIGGSPRGASVSATTLEGEVLARGREVAPGCFAASGLPAGPVVFVVGVGGLSFRRTQSGNLPALRFDFGTAVVKCQIPSGSAARLVVRDRAGHAVAGNGLAAKDGMTRRLTLLAGDTYQIALELRVGEVWRVIDEQEIIVEPGVEREILLRGP